MPASRRLLFILAVLTLLAPVSATTSDRHETAREQFSTALEALEHGRMDEFNALARRLKHYPLYSYLEYHALVKRLDAADHDDVIAFIERYADQPLAKRMRRNWLYVLARRKQWPAFLSTYRGNQPLRLQCYRLQARLQTKDTDGLAQQALKLWMVGHSQDRACDPVFDWLEREGIITQEQVWQRIRLAMREGHPSLAKYLAKRLPAADRAWVTAWRNARSRPASTLASKQLATDVPIAREIVLYAVRRIAHGDLDEGHEKWQSIRQRYDFEPEQAAELDRHIALLAAWRHHPSAHDWLTALPQSVVDDEVREWRARSAIATGDWAALVDHIRAMPGDEAGRAEWRYWLSRGLEAGGNNLKASNGLAQLAKERDYHGFLAADELDWPYEMGNRPLDVDDRAIDRLAARPGFLRAHELYRLDRLTDARREWYHATAGLTAEEFKLAAALASRWGWHDRAILTVARAQAFDDLVLRFPLAHREQVARHAGENDLDPGHVFAVIRQESIFDKDARSPAGARGLMQLMPRTGRITARRYSIPLGGLQRLYDADMNISIGTTYLNQVMDDYDRNIVLASAAYNAGPHRVKRWLPEQDSRDAREWVAMVPFSETRRYVQRVLAYSAIYDWRLGQPVTALKSLMPDVHPHERYTEDGR